MMNYIEEIRERISTGEIQEASTDLFEDVLDAVLGNPVSIGKIIITLTKSAFFIRERLFWSKMEKFLNGVCLSKQHFTTFTPPRKLMKLVYTRPELSPLDFLRFGP